MSFTADYTNKVEALLGLYLDTISGFRHVLRAIEETQEDSVKDLKLTISELDEAKYIYGLGHPTEKQFLHISTQGELKMRNKQEGQNYRDIANYISVLMYQYWEDEYREKIAIQLGITKDELKSDIFGDLRLIRHCVIHNQGKVDSDLAYKTKMLKWFQHGEEVFLNRDQVVFIVDEINKYLDSLPAKKV